MHTTTRVGRQRDSPKLISFSALKLAVTDANTFGDNMRRAAAGLYADVRLTTVTDSEATRENLGKVID